MKIGFIGTGKISGAIIESLCTSDLENFRIFVSPRNKENSLILEEKYSKVSRCKSNQELIDSSEIIFIGLRPKIFKKVLSDLNFKDGQSIISVIPFSYYNDLKELVFPAKNISRATPLPTVTTHVCPIPVYKASSTALTVLKVIGQPFEVNSEQELHDIWTLTCLISPYYDLLGSLSEWASENTVNKKVASKYVADMFHTLSNAAHLEEYPEFGNLSHHAATPGGLNEMTAKDIRGKGAHNAYIEAAKKIRAMFNL